MELNLETRSAASDASPVVNEVVRDSGFEVSSGSGLGLGLVMSFICRARSGIRMQSVEQVCNPEKREHHDAESENGEVGGAPAPPSAGNAHVEISGIDQPSNRRPRLF